MRGWLRWLGGEAICGYAHNRMDTAGTLVLALAAALHATAAQPAFSATATGAEAKKIVFLAAGGSHGWGAHAHYAGSMLLAKALNENVPSVQAVVSRGWPKDASVLKGVDALVICCDGGAHRLLGPHLKEVEELIGRGVGMAVFHYALAEPKGERGGRMLRWLGGYYETWWSVNPVWDADFKTLPKHPITRGVRPFRIKDEWYYHMRFARDMTGVTPILSAVPPESTRKRPDGAHSGNPHVRARAGMVEHVAWAYRRPWLRLHRRPLALELGARRLPEARPQRARLDRRRRGAGRWGAVEDPDGGGTGREPTQPEAEELEPQGHPAHDRRVEPPARTGRQIEFSTVTCSHLARMFSANVECRTLNVE